VKAPREPGATIWDYAALESLGEFRKIANDAAVILAYDTRTNDFGIVFGLEAIRAIASRVTPAQKMLIAGFALDFETDLLEHLCAAVQVTKGFHDWPTHQDNDLTQSRAQNRSKTVQVYDFATKKVTSIPASELAPGMVWAQVAGVGRVWVVAAPPKNQAPYRHPPFTEDI